MQPVGHASLLHLQILKILILILGSGQHLALRGRLPPCRPFLFWKKKKLPLAAFGQGQGSS